MTQDMSKPNPDYITPPDGTVVGYRLDAEHGYRKIILRNGTPTYEGESDGELVAAHCHRGTICQMFCKNGRIVLKQSRQRRKTKRTTR